MRAGKTARAGRWAAGTSCVIGLSWMETTYNKCLRSIAALSSWIQLCVLIGSDMAQSVRASQLGKEGRRMNIFLTALVSRDSGRYTLRYRTMGAHPHLPH